MQEINFSIIIPTYNRVNLVVEAIESALNQTYKLAYEVIVVDDGSTDETEKILVEYTNKEPKLKFIRNNKNKGVAFSRNVGIKSSKGKYLLFLDSDDKLLPDALYIFTKAIERYANGDVIKGKIIRENSKGEQKIGSSPRLLGDNKKNFVAFLRRKLPMETGSFVVKKNVIEKYTFPEELRLREDFPVYGCLILLHKCYTIEEPVIIIRDHSYRLRKETNLLIQRNIQPVEILFSKIPEEFEIFYPLAISREYLSIFRSFYLMKEYKKATHYYHEAIKVYPKHLFLISYFKKYLGSLLKVL